MAAVCSFMHRLSATCRTTLMAAGKSSRQHSGSCQQTHCSACVSCRPRCLFVQLADLPLSTGVGGFLLARAACEMLCEAMAAAWTAGRAAPVRRLMLLPQGGNSARVVSACKQRPRCKAVIAISVSSLANAIVVPAAAAFVPCFCQGSVMCATHRIAYTLWH